MSENRHTRATSAPRRRQALIDEPPLLVMPTAILMVGVDEAIFLQQLHYWLERSGKERDGRRWIWNSFEDWHAQFPWWSVRTLQRIVSKLRESGVVITSTDYNAHRTDRTLWYTIDYDVVAQKTEALAHDDKMAGWPRQSDGLENDNVSPSDDDTMAHSIPETTQRTPEISFEASKGLTLVDNVERYDESRLAILPYAQDFARELRDQAPLTSTVTRLVNMYRAAGVDLDTFIEQMYRARAIAQERTPAIRNQGNGPGQKSKMAYFLAVLEDLLGQRSGEASRNAGD